MSRACRGHVFPGFTCPRQAWNMPPIRPIVKNATPRADRNVRPTRPTTAALAAGASPVRPSGASFAGLRLIVTLATSGRFWPLLSRSVDSRAQRVGIDSRKDVRCRNIAAVGQHAGVLDRPAVAVAGPLALAETAVRLEDPGTDSMGTRIPADDFGAAPTRRSFRRRRTSES